MTDCPKYVPKYVLLCCCDYHDYFFFFNAAVVVAIRLTVHFLCVCIFVFLSFLFFHTWHRGDSIVGGGGGAPMGGPVDFKAIEQRNAARGIRPCKTCSLPFDLLLRALF